jgi:hypothetical protein
MAIFEDSNQGNDYQYYGCNVNTAEQVATRFTFPSVPNGGSALVHTVGVRVGGALNKNGRVRLAMWESNGTGVAAAASELTVGGTSPSSSHTLKYQSISKSVTSGGSYLIGFWRADSNCSYVTNFSFYNGSTRAIYFDNSASSPSTFTFNSTFDPSATLLFSIEYYYAPPTPASISASASDGSASVSWSAVSHAATDGGVSGYTVYSYDSAGTYISATNTTRTSIDITGLSNGSSYKFKVASYNSAGTGIATDFSSTVTPFGVPATPTGITSTKGNGEVSLSWTAPASNGSAITDYTVQYSTDNSSWITFTDAISTTASATVTGLTNGILYYFRVAAKNSAGTGSYTSSVSNTPSTIPSTPTGLSLVPSTTSITASWLEPANGGSAITDYIIQYKRSVDSVWITVSDGVSPNTAFTVTGLLETTAYDIRVAAINANGTSPYVSASTTTLTGTQPPSPPRNFVVGIVTPTQIPLSWSPPSTLNGTGITYKVSRDGIDIPASIGITATSYTDTPGDTNTHTYIVYAKNSTDARYSAASNTVITKVLVPPSAPPDNVLLTKINYSTLKISYTEPEIPERISSYSVQYKRSSDTSWTSNTTGDIVFVTDPSYSYDVRVAAVNDSGTGPYSAINTSTISSLPVAPVINYAELKPGKPGVSFNVLQAFPSPSDPPIVKYEISKDGGLNYIDAEFLSAAVGYYEISSINLNFDGGNKEITITTTTNHSYLQNDKIDLSGFSAEFPSGAIETASLNMLNNARNGIQYYTIKSVTSNTIKIDFDLIGHSLSSGTYNRLTHFVGYVLNYEKKIFEGKYFTQDLINGYSYPFTFRSVSFIGSSQDSNVTNERIATPGLMTAYDSNLEIVAILPKKFTSSSTTEDVQYVRYYDGSDWKYTKYPEIEILDLGNPSTTDIDEVYDGGTPTVSPTDIIDFGGAFQ